MTDDTVASGTPADTPVRTLLVGAQMLFVAFGALVLVPLLTGLRWSPKSGPGVKL